jgi:hypothetical protein
MVGFAWVLILKDKSLPKANPVSFKKRGLKKPPRNMPPADTAVLIVQIL